jgi:hypothetical protein
MENTERQLNAEIIVKPRGRVLPCDKNTPRHIRTNAPEIVAAGLIGELMREAFAKHGIATASHMPNMGVLADAIARGMGTADTTIPMPAKARELTEAEKAEHDGFID